MHLHAPGTQSSLFSASAPYCAIENSLPHSQRGGGTLGILNVTVIKEIS